jgi:hypothetical protein
MIIANLALAGSVNYNHKGCCKLKRTYKIVNCDPKPFIVQSTERRYAECRGAKDHECIKFLPMSFNIPKISFLLRNVNVISRNNLAKLT